jgi:signal transduction histidine kinase
VSSPPPSVNPTSRLLAGLAVILAVAALFSVYALRQISGLRALQLDAIDRNRRDSLQLLRIQGDLQNVALSMRDMAEGSSPYPITAYTSEIARIRTDLDDALETEQELAPTTRTAPQQTFLRDSVADFWGATERMFEAAEKGDDAEARRLIREVLQPRQASLANTVARLLVSNNEAEQAAAEEIQTIYDNVERNTYIFMIAVLAAMLLTGAYMVSHIRRIFRDLAQLSEVRQELAARLITLQEDLFESLARELHDEFGQTLTAAGAMLTRLERKADGPSNELKEGLREAKGVTQQALDGVRRLSQRLHPSVLNDFGLQGAVEWHVGQLRDQTEADIRYEKPAEPLPVIEPERAIHIYRVLQEALSNALRHSGGNVVRVRLATANGHLDLEVSDDGKGIKESADAPRGLGLTARRERAAVIGGILTVGPGPGGGTLVRLQAPMMSGK